MGTSYLGNYTTNMVGYTEDLVGFILTNCDPFIHEFENNKIHDQSKRLFGIPNIILGVNLCMICSNPQI